MTIVTLDASTLAKFQGIADYATIHDEAGRVVGFRPNVELLCGPDRKIISPISDEEWERRRNEPGRPTAKRHSRRSAEQMSYTVVWKPEAERELTALWLASRLRHLVNAAVNDVDRQLVNNPRVLGNREKLIGESL